MDARQRRQRRHEETIDRVRVRVRGSAYLGADSADMKGPPLYIPFHTLSYPPPSSSVTQHPTYEKEVAAA
jgi:hypothetical protein